MKEDVKKCTEKDAITKMDTIYLHTFVNWLYGMKDKVWEEYLELSTVQQNALIAEFDNYIRK